MGWQDAPVVGKGPEKSGAKWEAAPTVSTVDTGPTMEQMADPTTGLSDMEAFRIGMGRQVMAPIEAFKQMAAHAAGGGQKEDQQVIESERMMEALEKKKPAATYGKYATDLATGWFLPGFKAISALGPLGRPIAGALTGGAYGALSPVAKEGDLVPEKLKQMGTSAATGFGLSSLGGMIESAGPALKRVLSKMGVGEKEPITLPERGAGAKKAVDELQRIRGVIEGKEKPLTDGASAYERELTDFTESMRQMRERAFAEGGPVDVSKVLKQIERIEKSPQGQHEAVAGAIGKVKQLAERLLEQSGKGDLYAQMTPAQRKAWSGLKFKRETTLTPDAADELRQGINALIQQKDASGKPLYGLAEKQLSDIGNALRGELSDAHKAWLAAESTGRKSLEKYDPTKSVISQVTGDRMGTQGVDPVDAQRALNKALSGKFAGANLRELADYTKHHPEATQGMRQGFVEWLLDRSELGTIKPEAMIERWGDIKGPLKSSGLFDPDHYQNIENVMEQIKKSMGSSSVPVIGNMLGLFLTGSYKGALFGKQVGAKVSDVLQNDLQRAAIELAAQPDAARLLTAPVTETNRAALQKMLEERLPELEKAITTAIGRERTEAPPKPSQRKLRKLEGKEMAI